MAVSKLLRLLLAGIQPMSVVEVGGGAVGEDEEQATEVEAPAEEAAVEEADAETSEEDAPEEDADELIVSLGDPEAEAKAAEEEHRAPEWVRDLRKSNREKDRRIRELEQKLATAKPEPAAIVVGAKPTLESCEFDAEKFETELEAWHERKRTADDQQRAKQQAEEQQRQQWEQRVAAVKNAAAALKVRDYEEASSSIDDVFSPVQHGIIAGGPEDPKSSALLRYVLGKNPKKAAELAAIKDPVRFTFALAKLETQLKVTPRKTAPAPERQVRSTVAGAAALGDAEYQRLVAEADKSGDRSKVAAYLRNKQRQAA